MSNEPDDSDETIGRRDIVNACPECDSAPLRRRTGKGMFGQSSSDPGDRWYCGECKDTVAEPNRRERYSHAPWASDQMLERLGIDPEKAREYGMDDFDPDDEQSDTENDA